MRYENVAVIVPCYNEEQTIASVVEDAKKFLPGAKVYVYDNNSKDATKDVAERAGAVVRSEVRQGKGFAIRKSFIDATEDYIIMIDGDDTYDLSFAPTAVKYAVDNQLDFLNLKRIATGTAAYRRGHVLGNKVLTGAIGLLFGRHIDDMLSGYKVLSKRFVKSFPASSSGFEIETELLVHALELGIPLGELETSYKERPEGSVSKLSTYKDGARIGFTIMRLCQMERPILFFSIIAALFAFLSLLFGGSVVAEYFQTGLVERFPTAILAGFLGMTAIVLMGVGLTLDLVQRTRSDLKKIAFLAIGH
ncbi:glycosyltransferase family 2 protein [Ochrobactrum sp. BTU2]|uniref:glycosyltransferase family 2 protein n=1 Tax=Ochrobactrum sp. BTU2 TaxID=2856166 RepID=UPI002119CEA7|nr:glycosyltransferase family 2 protein [Ochrobactrum sp. BTU2]MCQ9148416.1 glycosyltransferase family 2 protein [Ochrobactrum sp. BTU2]